jgi:hypothetical protein
VVMFGTDQRITSGPAAKRLHSKGRIHGCTRTFRKRSDSFPLHRVRRPYMAHGRIDRMDGMSAAGQSRRAADEGFGF